MSSVPGELKYTKSHEWVRLDGDTVTVGITEHAQDLMGDMVFIEPPAVGASLQAESDCAVVESVKAASDIYAPIDGEVTESNDAIADSPELVNKDPYGDGWMFRMTVADKAQLDNLMDAAAYEELVASEEH
ncbi:MAG: glycine cleavage system protein GcvH [Proteobacteria bacterium]|nr:glycine cleavage system protein GcvH [Pseudomonadota bacterium]